MLIFAIMSKVTAYYHNKEDVYRFIWKEIQKLNCKLLRIGGIQNHVHMLINLHPSVALARLMQNVKGRSSTWMGDDLRFKNFKGWAADYYACTISPRPQIACNTSPPAPPGLSGVECSVPGRCPGLSTIDVPPARPPALLVTVTPRCILSSGRP